MVSCSICKRPRAKICADNTLRGKRYKENLKRLEDTENFFDAHDLVDKIDGESIAKFIDRTLNELLGCTLKDLADEKMVDRICRAFYKQEKVMDECIRNSDHPMFEGLLLCYIFHRMGKLFNKLNEPQIAAEYKELKDSMDVECTRLLQECFRKNKTNARGTLGINYHQDIHGCKCEFSHETRLMEIAYQGKKFLTHPVCQKAIDIAWHSSYKLNNPRVAKRSASSKFAFDRAFRFLYVIVYSVALIINSYWNVQKQNIVEFLPLIFVFSWQCMYIFEMIVIAVKRAHVMRNFFLIFLFVWVAYAVSHISLSSHMNNVNSTWTSVPWLIFYHGAFEVFGEAAEEDKKGEIDFCTEVKLFSFTDYSFHCLFRTWMLPLALFLYILVTATLLFNLLTALLISRYEEISKDYPTYRKVGLYARLTDYEESFSVMQRLLDIIVYMFRECCCCNNKSERFGWETVRPQPHLTSEKLREELRDFIANCRDNMVGEQETNKKSDQKLVDDVKNLLKDLNIDADTQVRVEGFNFE